MGFWLVVCWVRRALHCCITCLRRFVKWELYYNSQQFICILMLVPCNYSNASSFIFPICEWGGVVGLQFLMQWNIWEHLPTCSQSSWLPDRGGIQTNKRYFAYKLRVQCENGKGSQTFVHSVVTWSNLLFVQRLPCEPRALKKCRYLLKIVVWCFGSFLPPKDCMSLLHCSHL